MCFFAFTNCYTKLGLAPFPELSPPELHFFCRGGAKLNLHLATDILGEEGKSNVIYIYIYKYIPWAPKPTFLERFFMVDKKPWILGGQDQNLYFSMGLWGAHGISATVDGSEIR